MSMFGSKNDGDRGDPALGATTLLAKGSSVSGNLEFKGNLEIEGEIVGNITSEDENARIRILQGGSVKGDIVVATIIVNGRVRGDLYASKHVKLAAKAVVEGNLNYNLIEIEKENLLNFLFQCLPKTKKRTEIAFRNPQPVALI